MPIIRDTQKKVLWAMLFANTIQKEYRAHCAVCEQILSYLTGLLVRDTLSDSRQLSSFSSVMPERSSWTYSWDESVHSCLLFLSPPWKQNMNRTVIRLPLYTVISTPVECDEKKKNNIINDKRNLWSMICINMWFYNSSVKMQCKSCSTEIRK